MPDAGGEPPAVLSRTMKKQSFITGAVLACFLSCAIVPFASIPTPVHGIRDRQRHALSPGGYQSLGAGHQKDGMPFSSSHLLILLRTKRALIPEDITAALALRGASLMRSRHAPKPMKQGMREEACRPHPRLAAGFQSIRAGHSPPAGRTQHAVLNPLTKEIMKI